MRLRVILMVLALLAFSSASAGGYLYYQSLKDAALKDAEQNAAARVEQLSRSLSFYLTENVKSVQVLAGMAPLLRRLTHDSPENRDKANEILDLYKDALKVDVCYLMNHEGVTVTSSNRHAPDSFVGKNFAFRPYFQEAFHSAPYTYMALGTTSKKRGVYYSYPVFEKGEDLPIGLAVIKASIERIEKRLAAAQDEIILVADPSGVIFISNRTEWLYQLIRDVPVETIEKIRVSRQFGSGPWQWIGLTMDRQSAMDTAGRAYLTHTSGLAAYPGWQVVHLQDLQAIHRKVLAPFIRITGPIVLSLCVLIGLAVLSLYRRASREIRYRHKVENALRQSEERYRGLYHHTPAMLHSIDANGKLISVSDYWADVMGYDSKEVAGRKLTEFLSPASREFALNSAFPQFFKNGFCRDIPYQFINKQGKVIDVLLSAITERGDDGNILRSLAVSMDITRRKKAEKAESRLRKLSGGIMASQEKERSAIARELHDELGQMLTALRMDAVWMKGRLPSYDEKGLKRADLMCRLIDETIGNVRNMAVRLRPGVLDDLGLVDALEWYAADFERHTGITCIFKHENVPSVKGAVATTLYRVAQEALTNAARHARAERIQVVLEGRGKELMLSVKDDGTGFNPGAPSEQEGLGITGMNERSALVGGELSVHSAPGEGTEVRLYLRLPDNGDSTEMGTV